MCPALGAVAVYLTIWQEHRAGTFEKGWKHKLRDPEITTIDTIDENATLFRTPWEKWNA